MADVPQNADCLISIKTVQAGSLKSLFEVLKEILFDVNLVANDEGLRISAVDNSRVACVWALIDASRLDHYYVRDGAWNGGVSLQHLYKLLRIAQAGDEVALWVHESEPEKLRVRVKNEKSTTNFSYTLLLVDDEPIKLPSSDDHCAISIPSTYFQRFIREIGQLGTELSIAVKGSRLVFGVEGLFASQMTEIDGIVSENHDNNFTLKFSLKYLLSFSRASSLSSTVVLYMKKEWPLSMAYNVGDIGEVRFVLAPNIE
jgi:proliferating cell nuclear antigen